MIIGLCGTHGTGKSTIMKRLIDLGYLVDQTQLSRTAQKELGWSSLSIAGESLENVQRLQNRIYALAKERDDSFEWQTFVERTPADSVAYINMWYKKLGVESDSWKSCIEAYYEVMSQQYKLFVVVPINDNIPFEYDPNRADLDTRVYVQEQIISFLKKNNLPYIVLKSTSVEDRVNEILENI